ncbi:hypothetical protein [Mesobacillus zeae]|uniref:Head-tail adaptor protein n=1 Tax=Mesobacillus zeae TaxID=1917180 RepID=A0A398B6E3_9BACI|nr:hypothetical protein [Mesobacillus zeae]RID85024.1 hypothetical protein D1970_10680 [Mesobacillus zeae]
MPEMMSFKSLLDQYSVPFTAYAAGDGHWTDGGDWEPGVIAPVEMTGVILPFSDDDLRYAENGTYSVKDRKILTVYSVVEGQKVRYKNTTYTVQNFKDLSEYTDVNAYIARWAGNESSDN